MAFRLLRCWLAAAPLLAMGLAQAQGVPAARAPGAAVRCVAPEHAGSPLLEREQRIAQFETLGEPCLKQLLLECHEASSRQLLDSGTAFACSIGYEALLRRGFGGNFQALLAWWRERDAAALD